MQLDAPGIIAWVVLIGLLILLGGLGVVGWWLLRRRRRDELREELAEELEACVQRLGLGTVWQTSLFQADVYGIRGLVDGYDIRAELWEKSSRDFFRLSVHFPKMIGQSFRLLTRQRKGVEHLWRLRKVESGDEVFDADFQIYARPEEEESERLFDLFDDHIRRRLLSLGRRVDGLKLGDHSLYVYLEEAVAPGRVEELIDEALSLATDVYDGALDEGLPDQGHTTEYEMASVDMLGRESGDTGGAEEFPEGSDEEVLTLPDSDEDRLQAVGAQPEDDPEEEGGSSSRSSSPGAGSMEATSPDSTSSDSTSSDSTEEDESSRGSER